ncbi:Uma2 family endonuclease [Gloeobacter violaceus]|uniref:Glr3638 protein n=1 Tax=Gloeobacter violaceus (strain ATCC 29082 / PCC 7421) TaxID=251221 RepID=Q7NF88_GLOVI|nr:Uma2 family endonuclease [Gloeobacter violaceus]BAC91579.1 glr3638 [Gloeobacter violaceus PCC 7421]
MPSVETPVVYPDSDGLPMADNTRQFEWIVYIKKGLDVVFVADPTVFVAGDLLWYPVEGWPDLRAAPDAMVVFGRPKGDRGSYQQWKEDNKPPAVVFEVLSPGNTPSEMTRKFSFYERHGVEEYYIYDPDRLTLTGFTREGQFLADVPTMTGWTSPRLGVRFDLDADGNLELFRPDGRRFETFEALTERAERAEQLAEQAVQRAEQAEQRAARLAELLRQQGIDPADLP